ncbi:MAG: superoxide dismutase, Ni [Candidatus Aenigmarchaeota archaeon]|nr:superoxide dismutase, Ni [Candidatus Aenigmarchaeota archaeon]
MSVSGTLARILAKIDDAVPPRTAHAHCDIPCGVYEPDTMTWAAETACKMAEKLNALELPREGDKKARLEYVNTAARMVEIKEKFAHKCKEELLILWTDYFKPEHLSRFPDLHEKVWKAAKQCSTVKRGTSVEEAARLKEMVAEIAEIFRKSKS